MSNSPKTRQIAVFPLSIVAYPGTTINLHIFEERYKKLIQDCKNKGITFGIVPVVDSKLGQYGAECSLAEIVTEHTNGTLDIRVSVDKAFEVVEYFPTLDKTQYASVRIREIEHIDDGDEQLQHFLRLQVLKICNALKQEPRNPIPDPCTSFQVAQYCGLTLRQEELLLAIESEIERCGVLLEHIEKCLQYIGRLKKIKDAAQLNGQFQKLDSF